MESFNCRDGIWPIRSGTPRERSTPGTLDIPLARLNRSPTVRLRAESHTVGVNGDIVGSEKPSCGRTRVSIMVLRCLAHHVHNDVARYQSDF